MTTLDTEKFRKVDALARGGATPGERAAAMSRLDVMASAAGMTVDDARERAGSVTEEEKVAAHFRREHDRMRADPRRRERRRILAERYGSDDAAEEAIATETQREAALRRAVDQHVVRAKTTGWAMGSICGWEGGRDMPDFVRAAVEGAYAMPTKVAAIWTEYREWEELHADRDAFDPWYDSPVWDRAREHVLEIALDTIPAADLADVMARMDWLAFAHDRGFHRDVRDDLRWLATLRADVLNLHAVQGGHSTAKDRRAHAMSILDTAAGAALSDREIARRAGVSPTTVGKLRRGVDDVA